MKLPVFAAAAVLVPAVTGHATDFKGQVTPVLKQYCYKCHSEVQKKEKGKLVFDNQTRLAAKIGPNGVIKPGDAAGSTVYSSMTLPSNDDDHMPPAKEAQPPAASIALIKAWITEGASLDGKKVAVTPPVPPVPPVPPPPAPATPAAGGVQTWTSTDGKTIKATFLRMEGENVVIQRDDGVSFTVPLSRLSPESQAQAKNAGK